MSVTTGWPGGDDFTGSRRAHVDDAVDRRADLGVGEADVGLGPLRGRRRLHVLVRLRPGCAARRPARRSRAPAPLRRAARPPACQRVDAALRGLVRRARLIELSCRPTPSIRQSAVRSRVNRAFSRSATAAACCASAAASVDSA